MGGNKLMRNMPLFIVYYLLFVCEIFGLGLKLSFAKEETPKITVTLTVAPTLQLPTVVTGETTFDYSTYILTLNGTVNTHGLPTTTWFQDGKSSGSYSGTSTTQDISGTGDTAVSISVNINELPPNDTGITYYYYKIVAENDTGISYGEEKYLGITTPIIDYLPTPSPSITVTPTPQPPTATTGDVIYNYSDSSVTLAGIVNANGLSTTAWFEYGTTSDVYNYTTSTQTVSGSSDTTVSLDLSMHSLPVRIGSPYTFYYRIAAQNSAGTSYGGEKSFESLIHTDCPCSVSGKVTDAITKEGIKNAIISEKSSLKTSLTNADGSYSWWDNSDNCRSGNSYTLTVLADGYLSSTQSVPFGEISCEETLNFDLQPITTPTPTPGCKVEKITVSPGRLKLKRGENSEVIVTLEGNNCEPEGKTVMATIGKNGNRRISISSTNEVTDESGQAKFTITAKDTIGKTRVTFKTDNLKRSIVVKVR